MSYTSAPHNLLPVQKNTFGRLVVLLRVQNSQNSKEEVDDVQVERDGGSNLLLDMVVAHDELSVDQDVAREYQSRNDAVPKLDLAVVREESSHESEQDKNPDSAKKVWSPVCEIVLALAREQTQSNEDA